MYLSENLKFLRKSKGLSQKELADSVGVSQVIISQYETGIRVPLKPTAIVIAQNLGVSYDELINVNLVSKPFHR